jgi:2-dehydropantoate 2-reductase
VIAVFGAGAIGCWIGGMLAAGGAPVTLIGRARVVDELADGVTISELDGPPRRVVVPATTDPAAAAGAAHVIVAVKSPQTAEAGAALAAVLGPEAVVVSFQNGVRNPDVLRAALPGRPVLAAMVPYNVVRRGPGAYHRASEGVLRIADDPSGAPLVAACRAAGLAIEPRADMPAVQWAKLVMNLNNAINALSDLPLARELADRDLRRCLAGAQAEALALLAAADQPIARLAPLSARWVSRLLPLPNWVVRPLVGRIVGIHPEARSSMWDDLEAGRPTEIAVLQGEVVALAERLGRAAPINAALLRLVRDAEAGGPRRFSGVALRAAIGA